MNSLLRLLGLDGGTRVSGLSGHEWRLTEPMSGWLVALILLVGLGLAVVNFHLKVKMRMRVRVYTCVLRVLMVLVLLGLFQQVELRVRLDLRQRQDWVVLLDDSASMATKDAGGGTSRYAAAKADAARIEAAARGKVRVTAATLSGAPAGAAAGRGPTRLRDAIAKDALATSGVNRLVLLTDGRDTERRDLTELGSDLKARGVKLDVKLYGSEAVPADAGIFAEPERAVIRLGEDLVVRGSITGKTKGETCTVRLRVRPEKVTHEGAAAAPPGELTKEVTVSAAEGRQFAVSARPRHAGTYICTVELPDADLLQLNNAYSFKVQVVKEKIKVLMIEGFPRFEFKLMKVALEVDPMVELTTIVHIPGGGVYVQGKPLHRNPREGLITSQSELFKYDVVVLRDVPRQYFRAGGDTSETRLRNIVDFVVKRGGGLIVCGGEDVFKAGHYEDSALMEVLPFDLSDYYSREAQFPGMFYVMMPKAAHSHLILRLLPEAAQNRERLSSLRQLDGSNNVGRFKPLATPLMTRLVKLKNAAGTAEERETPIMAYQAVGDGKVIGAAVDTLWRWQLQPDFDDPPLQALLANMVRYVAPPPKSQPGLPIVKLVDASPQVGQEVVLSTLLKNKNYDPVRKADLRVTAELPDGSKEHIYPRDLPEQPGYYEYRIQPEQPGGYTVTAEYGKMQYVTSFMVESSAGEFADLSADRAGMQALADAAGGRVIASVDEWLKGVNMKPETRVETRNLQVWNSPLMLLVLFGLVCADCHVRKREGLA